MIRILAGIACLSLATGAEVGPREMAMAFLDSVRQEELDLAKDTALSSQTTRAKRSTIEQRLDHLAEELQQGDCEVIEEKKDGKLAAVLIAQTTEFDPSQVQVHAIGLVLREEVWLPAPVPASFDNTGIRYIGSLAESAVKLERWMLEERARRIEAIRSGIRERLTRKIQATLTRDELLKEPPEKLVNGFIDACRAGSLPGVLAYIGGLEDPPPEMWQETVALTATGLRKTRKSMGAWGRLIAKERIRATVHTETQREKAFVWIGEFDPLETRPRNDAVTIRPFSLTRTREGFWRLDPPSWLYDSADDELRSGPADVDLTAAFPLKLLGQTETVAFDDPKALGEAYLRDLSQSDFGAVFPKIRAETEKEALGALRSYASVWRDFNNRQRIRLLLDASADGDQACALYCEIDPYDPELRGDLMRKILMVRDSDGWRLGPDASPDLDDFTPRLREWSRTTRAQEHSEWLGKLGLEVRLGGIAADSAPPEEEAGEAAKAWVDAIRSRQPGRMFTRVAIFDDDEGVERLFAYLGQELSSHSTLEILGLHRKGRWSAVSIRHSTPDSKDPPIDLLHPIIRSSAGPKILPEGILYMADTRARKYLNEDVMKRLGERLPKQAVDELREVHEEHTKLCREIGGE